MDRLKGALLVDRAILAVSGPQAESFLQGLVTVDVSTLAPGEARLAALLTPQGKILFDFLLLRRENEFLLDCRAEVAEDLLKRLTFYRLRAKVEIEDRSGMLSVIALWGDAGAVKIEGSFTDPRLETMGLRAIAEKEKVEPALREAGADIVPLAEYHAQRVHAGIGEGGLDFAFGEAFPHEANMDLLGGVSFTKGCFVGQEVVSRMEHRGTARTRIVPVRFAEGAARMGEEITSGGKGIGTLGSVAGSEALAMMRLDRAREAAERGEKLHAGDAILEPRNGSFAATGGEA
jgi:hypothetical protein